MKLILLLLLGFLTAPIQVQVLLLVLVAELIALAWILSPHQ